MNTVEFCLYADVGLNAGNKIYMACIRNPRDFLGVDDDGDLISPLADQWPFSPKVFITITDIRTAVNETAPEQFSLGQNYPNPFNPTTIIPFTLSEFGNVHIDVFSVSGQFVATLADGYLGAGQHNVAWNAGNQSAGIYFIKMEYGNKTVSKKVSFVK